MRDMKINIEKLKLAAAKSKCKRRQVGAVGILRKGIIPHCNQIVGGDYSICDNCPREGQEHGNWSGNQECPAIHAEEAVILNAARGGYALDGATLLVTDKPCNRCARLIYGAGFNEVIYLSDMGSSEGIDYLRKCGVEVERYQESDPIIKENPDEGVLE